MILTCNQLVRKATDAREGRLSLLDRLLRRVHLGWCRHCRRYERQLDVTLALLRPDPDED